MRWHPTMNALRLFIRKFFSYLQRRWKRSRMGRYVIRVFAHYQQQRWAKRVATEKTNPLLVYVVPYDIVRMTTGGAKRIVGISDVLGRENLVVICSKIPTHQVASVVQISKNVHLCGIPEGKKLHYWFRMLAIFSPAVKVWIHTIPSEWNLLRKKSIFLNTPLHLYDAHDDYIYFLKNILKRAESFVEEETKIEECFLHSMNMVFFCTSVDLQNTAKRYEHLDKSNWLIIPNGIFATEENHEVHEFDNVITLRHPLLLFVGSNFGPNFEAADWINQHVAPHFKHAQFIMMGMREDLFLHYGGQEPLQNVTFTGTVSETIKRHILLSADIALTPMQSGSGSSLKVPEYILHKKVIIGTSIGLRGFENFAQFPSIIITEDIVGDVAKILQDLSLNPRVFESSCEAAKKLLIQTHDWEVIVEPLCKWINDHLEK